MAYDLVIRDVEILDGTGAPAFRGDLAVADGGIAEVGVVTGGVHAQEWKLMAMGRPYARV